MVNGESVSGATQLTEAPINANHIQLDNQSRYCCQDYYLTPGLQFQVSLSIAHRLASAGFFSGQVRRAKFSNLLSLCDHFGSGWCGSGSRKYAISITYCKTDLECYTDKICHTNAVTESGMLAHLDLTGNRVGGL